MFLTCFGDQFLSSFSSLARISPGTNRAAEIGFHLPPRFWVQFAMSGNDQPIDFGPLATLRPQRRRRGYRFLRRSTRKGGKMPAQSFDYAFLEGSRVGAYFLREDLAEPPRKPPDFMVACKCTRIAIPFVTLALHCGLAVAAENRVRGRTRCGC